MNCAGSATGFRPRQTEEATGQTPPLVYFWLTLQSLRLSIAPTGSIERGRGPRAVRRGTSSPDVGVGPDCERGQSRQSGMSASDPLDITAGELAVETFLPADEATRRWLS